MSIIRNYKIDTILKYIYLGISLLCYFKSFFDSIDTIDSIIYIIRDYLPIIGLVLIMFTIKINIKKTSSILYLIMFLIYSFATCIGRGNVINEYIILTILAILFKNDNPKHYLSFIYGLFK